MQNVTYVGVKLIFDVVDTKVHQTQSHLDTNVFCYIDHRCLIAYLCMISHRVFLLSFFGAVSKFPCNWTEREFNFVNKN